MVNELPATALPLLEIIGINILLSWDNAVVVALAARRLPLSQRRPALLFGVGGSVVLFW
jgi:predicted tellurium resistance membrane protein TerC